MEATPSLLDLTSHKLPLTTAGALRGLKHAPQPGWLWQKLHHKRWYYFSAANEAILLGCSIVNLGYLAKGFVYVAERASKKLIAHRQALVPAGPWCTVSRTQAGGGGARFTSPLLSLRFSREPSGVFSVRGSGRGLDFTLVLSPTAEPVVAANRLATAATNVTEKGLAHRVRGSLTIGSKNFSMDDALAGSDFTNGYLPRHTTWKWASVSAEVDGHDFGLNLVQGFMGACECVAVIDGTHTGLGEALIDARQDPMQDWRVRTSCDRVDLRFSPFALHQDNTDLRVIHAKFKQPIGLFSGRVMDLQVQNAIGVCENQDVLW